MKLRIKFFRDENIYGKVDTKKEVLETLWSRGVVLAGLSLFILGSKALILLGAILLVFGVILDLEVESNEKNE